MSDVREVYEVLMPTFKGGEPNRLVAPAFRSRHAAEQQASLTLGDFPCERVVIRHLRITRETLEEWAAALPSNGEPR